MGKLRAPRSARGRVMAAAGMVMVGSLGIQTSSSLSASSPAPDVIVVDPPRAGIDETVSELLLTVPAKRLIYVSCDPGTQARDIARLAPAWKVRHSRPYDMFPYTPHVENMVVLDRIPR